MNLSSITAALGAALILAGAPLLAAAADVTPAPIQINDRAIVQDDGLGNESDASATAKAFVLEDQGGGLIERVEHFGCYGEGATPGHDFTDIESANKRDVTDDMVPFAGGSVWETDAGC